MRIDIITLFPSVFDSILNESILKIAREKGIVEYIVHDLRDYSAYPRRQVDDRPYGGGPGMLIMVDPVFRAVEDIEAQSDILSHRIVLTPGGRTYSQSSAQELSGKERLLLLCGRYEGFDQRIIHGLGFEEISIGDYIISGGEAAAMVIIESVVRLIPGVLGNEESAKEESFCDPLNHIVEYPQYTRPSEYRSMKVPDVLLSGNHAEIASWRRQKAVERTRARK